MEHVEPLAFSATQVCRLTSLSLRQLRYWDDTDFFSPEHVADEGRYGAYSKLYSFRDVVGLYTVALLRKRYRFSLQELRPVGEYLRRYHDTPWASLAFYVLGHNVYFRDPDNPESLVGARPMKQGALAIEMEKIANDVRERIVRLRRRAREQVGQIERHRYVVRNASVLAGTRVPTAAVWRLHEAGYTAGQIVNEYPRLTEQDVQAALSHERRRRTRRAAG